MKNWSILIFTVFVCPFLPGCKYFDESDSNGTVSAKSYCREDVWGFDAIEVDEKYHGSDLLVEGKIYQSFGEPYTHPAPFEFREGAQVLVTLGCTNGYTDVPSTFISKQVITNVNAFPIEFELYGDSVEASNITHCDIAVNVRREPSKMCVGDLTNEYLEYVDIPSTENEVNVTGLESCDSPGAGGFCF